MTNGMKTSEFWFGLILIGGCITLAVFTELTDSLMSPAEAQAKFTSIQSSTKDWMEVILPYATGIYALYTGSRTLDKWKKVK